MGNLNEYIKRRFGVDDINFFEVLKISRGAEGYLLGSLGEQLFKKYAEDLGYEVLKLNDYGLKIHSR